MNFIKKVFDNTIDERTHLQFQKFSKGEFKDRAMIDAKKSNDKYTIRTTAEFANELVKEVAKKIDAPINVTGAIVSTQDLTGCLEFKEKKQFQGVKRYFIDKEMSKEEIIGLVDKFPKAFFALSFVVEKDDTTLKIKPKAPKSGKPKTKKGEKPKPNFCKLVTRDKELGESFVFETRNWKNANISHDFIINDIILPEGEKDYEKIRELAKRKGKIIRIANIDGKEITTEKEFSA